jgi:hypothetical protein
VILHHGRVLLHRPVAAIGSRVRMMHSASPPPSNAQGLLYSEPAVGGFWSVWQDASEGGGMLDLEVLFNAIVARPELAQTMFGAAGGAA